MFAVIYIFGSPVKETEHYVLKIFWNIYIVNIIIEINIFQYYFFGIVQFIDYLTRN